MNTKHTISRTAWTGRLFAVLLLILAVGCSDSDFLSKEPLGQLTSENFFKTEQDAVYATNATYNMLRAWQVHVFAYLGMTDITSDDAVKGSTPSDAGFLKELDDFTYSPSNIALGDTWSGYYQGIYRANLAINKIPSIDMDANLKNRLVGENKFLRAYFYFYLVRAFGGVPLITKPLNPDEYIQPRATADEVYAQIEQDLKDAIEVLPVKSDYSAADVGRATKGAAQGLLAKVYLFQGDYENAQTYAEDVITSGQYSLYPDYDELFTRAGENSSESLFEVQATAMETNQGGSQYSQVQGVRGTPNLGWGFNNPSDNLEFSYEEGDPRMESTILFVGEKLPDDSGMMVHKNPNMVNEKYNQKSFVTEDRPGNQGDSPKNIRILRYADVLLVAAEAAYHNNDITSAQNYLNQVRERARGGQTATLGISAESLPQTTADTLGISAMAGSPFVRYLSAGSPAENGGLKNFKYELVENNSIFLVDSVDVIQSVDGTTVNTLQDFKDAMKSKAPGQTVTLVVNRYSQTYSNGQVATAMAPVTLTATTDALLPDVTASGQTLLDAIWHERRSELAMEQHRWFDLLRQGRAIDVMTALGKDIQQKHTLFPIPQGEIDISGGELTQNPGWNQ